jgi:ketosteroid isomerase-like protein
MAREIVTQILGTYAALADGELEPALRLLSDDFVCDETHTLPDAKVYSGRDGFIAWADEVGERWRELDFAIDDVSDLGDAIVVSAHVELRGRMSGVTVRQSFAQVFELRGDRVARLTTFPTVEAALRALRPPKQPTPRA